MSEARGGLRRPLLVVVPVLLFVVVFIGARMIGGGPPGNPFVDRPPLVVADTAAAGAAASASGGDRDLLDRLSKVPQGTWLTPEAFPVGQVGARVSKVAAQAEVEKRTPVFVVYGITDRDCSGGESSGGLPADQYPTWVAEIASAMGSDAAVVVEPDALATAAECGQGEQRTTLLRDAVTLLADRGAVVYLDAGHASWTDPQVMAGLLRDSGVEKARGFSTNVSGYESDADERTYAETISTALDGAHYVTDTGRNGAGSNGEWCNPGGRALGRAPAASTDGALDAYLWIKPPGESDGTCGGGPPAGQFWAERALAMARAAGW
ncbi:glycoside hydrolase family 6 protein [Aeromicrobium fastidiosum]|uniref:glycoside hydrolase family 6 protein n=1 Tax=Aeromicrobium fastidiosum TaxID=52699 RepID=UPI00202377AF|nr:glycoside hydrolase family 6 protein [Aeromicrobium fastidiosum]MCL8250955.1 glycoside hydrolase family 6 protein [Aeromicrobium fastidiosum]